MPRPPTAGRCGTRRSRTRSTWWIRPTGSSSHPGGVRQLRHYYWPVFCAYLSSCLPSHAAWYSLLRTRADRKLIGVIGAAIRWCARFLSVCLSVCLSVYLSADLNNCGCAGTYLNDRSLFFFFSCSFCCKSSTLRCLHCLLDEATVAVVVDLARTGGGHKEGVNCIVALLGGLYRYGYSVQSEPCWRGRQSLPRHTAQCSVGTVLRHDSTVQVKGR